MLENVHGIFSICVHIFVREDFSWDFTRMYPAKKGCSGMKSAAYPLVMTKFTGSHGRCRSIYLDDLYTVLKEMVVK